MYGTEICSLLSNRGKGLFKVKKGIKDWFEALIEAGIIILVLFLLFWPVEIKGNSMKNSFDNGDMVAISRIMKIIDKYEKGDVVVLSVEVEGKNVQIIKRVIAEEGDRIVINKGNVFVNEVKLIENYVIGNTYGEYDIIVPENSVYILGDNREDSYDSRNIGSISKKDISGKVIAKLYPIKDMKIY